MKAWLFQEKRDVEKHGAKKAPWSVGWYGLDGKRHKKKRGLKTAAEAFKRKIERELAEGVDSATVAVDWAKFREQYERDVASRLAKSSRDAVRSTFNHFERICKPKRLSAINAAMFDAYTAKRLSEPGKKPKSTTAESTVCLELTWLRIALLRAEAWHLIAKAPKVRKPRVPERIGDVVTPADFEAILASCSVATRPEGRHYPPEDWWTAYLTFLMTTGWRYTEVLELRKADVDLSSGRIITRHGDNKGKRDEADYLPPGVADLLIGVVGFGDLVFDWPLTTDTLRRDFHAIQKAAGIYLACPDADEHDCTEACHYYGFHAIRRGYASVNVARLPAPVLQRKMRHKSFITTQRYLKLGDAMKESASAVWTPTVAQAKRDGTKMEPKPTSDAG